MSDGIFKNTTFVLGALTDIFFHFTIGAGSILLGNVLVLLVILFILPFVLRLINVFSPSLFISCRGYGIKQTKYFLIGVVVGILIFLSPFPVLFVVFRVQISVIWPLFMIFLIMTALSSRWIHWAVASLSVLVLMIFVYYPLMTGPSAPGGWFSIGSFF